MTIAGKPLPHESARGHVTGDALYTDDLLGRFPNVLHAWPVTAPSTIFSSQNFQSPSSRITAKNC